MNVRDKGKSGGRAWMEGMEMEMEMDVGVDRDRDVDVDRERERDRDTDFINYSCEKC